MMRCILGKRTVVEKRKMMVMMMAMMIMMHSVQGLRGEI
jgi:hypothetical protein